jgi:Flp pilus assembly protein TadG
MNLRTKSGRSRARGQRGQALAEFSLVLLPLLTLLFGVAEVGRMMFIYVTLADAARNGARYAIVHGSYSGSPSGFGNESAVSTKVTSITTAAGITGATAAVTYTASGTDTSGNLTGDTITVTASYTFSPIVALVPLGSFTLSSTSKGKICY